MASALYITAGPRSLAARLPTQPAISFALSITNAHTRAPPAPPLPQQTSHRVFSTTSPSTAQKASKTAQGVQKTAKKQQNLERRDSKIVPFLKHLSLLTHFRLPSPLKLGRNRYLRHWTIHRAWLLYRRQQREAHERDLMRMHASMQRACEALRTTRGPGSRPEGFLYRVAMQKKGIYGLKGFPIEFARPMVETPAREAWNHEWKRDDE